MKEKLLQSKVIIKIHKKDLIKMNQNLHSLAKVIRHEKDYIILKLNDQDCQKLSGIKYEIINYQGIKRINQLFLSNISVFIGIILFLLILYINTLTIKSIKFSTTTKDNEKIKSIIENYTTSYYNMRFLNHDINEINLLLRKEFSHYEWISVQKDGTILNVTILEPSIINKQVKQMEGSGDLIANKDGIIKYFKVSHGIPLIEQNLYVKKGQVLVTGNLRYNNYDESSFYIPASGEVYAEVWYTKTIQVRKQDTTTEYTGRIKTEKVLKIFDLNFKYKSYKEKYDQYDQEVTYEPLKILKFECPFGIKKIHYLEKNDIINVYDNKTSYDYAYSTVKYELMKDFNENDKILDISLLNKSETEDQFIYVFFVRTYEDIALFQRSK